VQSSSQIVTTNKPTSSFITGRMPFLSPNQQCQSTEGNNLNVLLSRNDSKLGLGVRGPQSLKDGPISITETEYLLFTTYNILLYIPYIMDF